MNACRYAIFGAGGAVACKEKGDAHRAALDGAGAGA